MPIDPNVNAELNNISVSVDKIRKLVDIPVVNPPTEPPATSVPVTITNIKVTRPNLTNVEVEYSIAGTNSRMGKVAIAWQPGNKWQEYDKPNADGTGLVRFNPGTNAGGKFHFHVWDNEPVPGHWVLKTDIDYPAFGTTTTPPVVIPPVPATGKFTFANTNGIVEIRDDGKLFIPIGVNVPGPNGYWGGGFTPIGKAQRLKQDWGWNFIRLFEQRSGGGDCGACPSAHNQYTIQQVVDEYTAAGFVVMIDWHQYDFGASLNQAKTNEMIQVWTAWANQFKSNPRVWFELCNEPENDGGGMDTAGMANRWYEFQKPVIQAIRATGATNMIVVNDGNAGQGCSDYFKIGPSSGSAIMARGADLVASDPTGNIMWDVHAYDNFGWSSPGEANNDCSNRYTDQQRDARFVDYVKRIWQTTSRPVLAGEFGWQNGESPTTGSGFHYPYTQCGSRTLKGQQAFTRTGNSLNMGGTQWPGFQLTTNGNDAYSSQNLTECGKDWFAYCQKVSAKNNDAVLSRMMADNEELLDTFRLARPQRLTVQAPDQGERPRFNPTGLAGVPVPFPPPESGKPSEGHTEA